MRADEFVIETIAFFAKGVEGPPPVVPFHAGAEFETRLVDLCYQQQLSALVADALGELALPPSISRITIARINNYAIDLKKTRNRRLSLLGRILDALSSQGITAVLAGDAWFALLPGKPGALRSVDNLDLLIDEKDWAGAVSVLRRLGFARSLIQPRLASQDRGRDDTGGFAEALYYHHYFSPLLMHDHNGDRIQIRFRVIDFGRAETRESAWDRVRKVELNGRTVSALSREDQLIHTVVGFGTGGFVELASVLDAGYLAAGHSDTLDWAYITRKLRHKGIYSAFCCTLEHVCNLLHVGKVMDKLQKPSRFRRRLFEAFWRAGEVDYSCEIEPAGGRFLYCLVECGGLIAKIDWLRRSLSPKPSWVKSVYGRPSNPWLRVKFLYDVRSGRRKRTAAHRGREADSRQSGME